MRKTLIDLQTSVSEIGFISSADLILDCVAVLPASFDNLRTIALVVLIGFPAFSLITAKS